jgi:hypothetical protein
VTNDRVPPRRLAGRLLLLAVLAAALAVAWLAVSSVALASMDDVCVVRAPAEATAITQDGELWPPTVVCRYTTAGGVVSTREDGELQMRLTAIAIAGVLAVGTWALVAHRVLRPRVGRTQDLAAGPRA